MAKIQIPPSSLVFCKFLWAHVENNGNPLISSLFCNVFRLAKVVDDIENNLFNVVF